MLWFWARGCRHHAHTRAAHYIVAGLLGLLSLKAKESALLIPLVLLVFGVLADAAPRWAPGFSGPRPEPAPEAGLTPSSSRSSGWRMAAAAALPVMALLTVALTMASDARFATDPGHPYHVGSSPAAVLGAFSYYLSALAFFPAALGPLAGGLALLTSLGIALWLRSGMAVLGWCWMVAVCAPVSLLANHWQHLNYPYAAAVGAALLCAAVLVAFENRIRRRASAAASTGVRIVLLSIVALMTLRGWHWTRRGELPGWHAQIHSTNAARLEALADRSAPVPATDVVIVDAELSPFDHDPGSVVRFVFDDRTLDAHLFRDVALARAHVASSKGPFLLLERRQSRYLELIVIDEGRRPPLQSRAP